MAALVAEGRSLCKAGFRTGEAQLSIMDKQLKNLEFYKEDNHSYLVDRIIKFYSLKNLGYQGIYSYYVIHLNYSLTFFMVVLDNRECLEYCPT